MPFRMSEQDAVTSDERKANLRIPHEVRSSTAHLAAKEERDATVEVVTEPRVAGTVEATSTTCYSVFSLSQKRLILFLTAFAGMLSPISSFIFYPAITSIAKGIDVPIELVNLTITSYMVVSGVVPALLGNAADNGGRRPVYIAALSVYIVANIGLALQNSFPALLILRMIQSAGSSGQLAVAHSDGGVINI